MLVATQRPDAAMANGETEGGFVAALRNWIATDPLTLELSTNQSLVDNIIEGRTMEGRPENDWYQDTLDATVPGTLEFRAAAAEGTLGVAFPTGLYQQYARFSPAERTLHGLARFPSATPAGHAGTGAVEAALDEILASTACNLGCFGFTACLAIERPEPPLPVPAATTLRFVGRADGPTAMTSKGGVKCRVAAQLLSADGEVVYAKADALFVQPLPTTRYSEAAVSEGRDVARIVQEALARDPQKQELAERRREASLDVLRVAPGSPALCTHLPGFAHRQQLWLSTDPFVSSLAPGQLLDAAELQGKIFSFFAGASDDKGVLGAAYFTHCAEGPPATAHGGSRFALLSYAAQLALRSHSVLGKLERCEVHMKAPVPLGATLKVEVRVEAVVGNRLTLAGRLADVDGSHTYDVVRASAVLAPRSCKQVPDSQCSAFAAATVASRL